MKHSLLFVIALIAGCQSRPTRQAGTPAPARAAAQPQDTSIVASAAPPSPLPDPRIRQQAQYIEALISQNDALRSKLAGPPASEPPKVSPPPVVPFGAGPPPNTIPVPMREATLAPNAENVIDLCAIAPSAAGAPTNPFAVRTVMPESVREVSLRVEGVIAGPVACAIINERLLQAGDNLESLVVEQVDANAVFLRFDGRRLRLPVSTEPVRIRLPL
jgi:hypothetical protein